MGFCNSNNTARAVLTLKHTFLHNRLISMAMCLQQTAKGLCGYVEELVVQARGSIIQFKIGAGEPIPYPFLIHFQTRCLPGVLFKCTHPHVCQLRREYASLFSGSVLFLSTLAAQGSPFLTATHFVHPLDTRYLLNRSNHKLCYFLHELQTFYEQASSLACGPKHLGGPGSLVRIVCYWNTGCSSQSRRGGNGLFESLYLKSLQKQTLPQS